MKMNSYELMLDIDGNFKRKDLMKRLAFLWSRLRFNLKKIDEKKTKHGRHFRIVFSCKQDLTDVDLVFLQLALGSDYHREIFNWCRIKAGFKRWNVLFNKKYDASGKLISQEI